MISPLDRYARTVGRPVEALRLRAGESADVVLDDAAGLAWRFPRRPAGRAGLTSLVSLASLADRMRLVRAHGIPAPEVVEVREDCLVMRLVDGEPLAPGREPDPAALTGLLERLSSVPLSSVPLASVPLASVPPAGSGRREEWRELVDDVRRLVVPLLAPEQARRALADATRALRTAGSAPTGFVHGDLGGANILVAGPAGAARVAGVLDWEAAGPGDPAVDLAALSVSVGPATRERLAAAFPGLAARADAYAATFALQEAVYGLREGDASAVEAGLAPYRRTGGPDTA
ncbi:aminoglycoside phosphotransferase family protein [Nonomuraea sp. SMC257]|uniref:Aminoglycoside phosphotransferase family protein n=1 Tax=Nonomuraea montanisoli TaxID=2741721 RepID=A0A7Y6I662_9ACTN|nr:aminoglycoside phosphotransferase family protein [Nonomuraea montanisoli]NUW31450.1 aminoglycoside phosphotransferase family protein [Nonomuraea montanisoli]